MKTRIISTAMVFIFTLFLISGTTKASERVHRIASGHENATDPALIIENWMTDANYWNNPVFGLGREYDSSLQLEAWMTNPADWGLFNHAASEEPLKLESWMWDNTGWNTANINSEELQETKLTIESWMTDSAYWCKSQSR